MRNPVSLFITFLLITLLTGVSTPRLRAAFPIHEHYSVALNSVAPQPPGISVVRDSTSSKPVTPAMAHRRRMFRTVSLVCGILFLACIGIAAITGVAAWLIGWPVFGIAAVAFGADKDNGSKSAGFILGMIAFAPVFAVFLLPRFIGVGVNGFLNLFRKPGKKRSLPS